MVAMLCNRSHASQGASQQINFALQKLTSTQSCKYHRQGMLILLFVIIASASSPYVEASCMSNGWTDLSRVSSPPPARSRHGLVVDQDRLYVFGGYDGASDLNDFHEYHIGSSTWKELSISTGGSSPSARQNLGFAATLGGLFVFGGYDGTYLNDLFRFDLASSTWEDRSMPVSGVVPSARRNHGMSAHEGSLYVFGGSDGSSNLNDLHSYDASQRTWSDLSTPSLGLLPSPRCCGGMAISDGQLYLFGGYDDSESIMFNDLRRYDILTRAWTDLSEFQPAQDPGSAGPSKRFAFGFTAWDRRLYVFGGFGNPGRWNDLFEYDIDAATWTEIPRSEMVGSVPSARQWHAMSAARGRLFVSGGWALVNGATHELSDLHSFVPLTPCDADAACAAHGRGNFSCRCNAGFERGGEAHNRGAGADTGPEGRGDAGGAGTAGTAGTAGEGGCRACAEGTFKEDEGAHACTPCGSCPAGEQRESCSGAVRGNCTPCAAGSSKQGGDVHRCSPCAGCPAGQYRARCGAHDPGACAACPTASYKHTAGPEACRSCAMERCEWEGVYRTGCGGSDEGVCVECLPRSCHAGLSRVCNASSVGSCRKCADGTFKPSSGPEACLVCLSCPAGAVRQECGGAEGGGCVACEPGSFKLQSGSGPCDMCESCRAGSMRSRCTPFSTGFCQGCAVGKYKTTTGTAACQECAACPAGLERMGCGGSEAGTCEACRTGRFKEESGAAECERCASCPSGLFRSGCKDADPGSCLACAAGTYKALSTAESCSACSGLACGPGLYREGCGGATSGACNPCPAGFFKAMAGPEVCARCQTCPPGEIRDGCQGPRAGECRVCDSSTFKPLDAASNECESCPACVVGEFRAGCVGSDPGQCLPCSPSSCQVGFQRSCRGSEVGVCEACPRGTFKPDDGAHACQDCRGCPAGQFRAGCGGVSAGRCEECGNGTFKGWEGPDEGCTACAACPVGEYRSGCLGASGGSCHVCAIGSWKPVATRPEVCASCGSCEPGSFRSRCNGSESGSCDRCPDQSFKASNGSRPCLPCAACPEGRYRSRCGAISPGTCRPCPSERGNGQKIIVPKLCQSCDGCPPGLFRAGCAHTGAGAQGTCLVCPPGTFKSTSGSESCRDCSGCEPGSFRIGCEYAEAGSCVVCPDGTFKESNRAEAGCVKCGECGQGSYRSGCGIASAGTCTVWTLEAQATLVGMSKADLVPVAIRTFESAVASLYTTVYNVRVVEIAEQSSRRRGLLASAVQLGFEVTGFASEQELVQAAQVFLDKGDALAATLQQHPGFSSLSTVLTHVLNMPSSSSRGTAGRWFGFGVGGGVLLVVVCVASVIAQRKLRHGDPSGRVDQEGSDVRPGATRVSRLSVRQMRGSFASA